jgi:hypothetical protein
MQQADKAEAGRDVVHDRLRVDTLQAVDDVGELEGWVCLWGDGGRLFLWRGRGEEAVLGVVELGLFLGGEG